MDELADLVDAGRLAVGRQPHHLELVAVVEEPEVLRDGRVEHPQRVREVDPVEHLDVVPAPDGLRGRDEVAEPVDGSHGGLVERRAEKGAGEVGRVVLHVVHWRERLRNAERVRQRPLDLADGPLVLEPVEDERDRRPLLEREERLLREVRLGVAADGDVGHLRAVDPGHVEAPLDRLRREASVVLDAREPLLFEGGHNRAVAEEDGGDVAVVGVDAEDVHGARESVEELSRRRGARGGGAPGGSRRRPAGARNASRRGRRGGRPSRPTRKAERGWGPGRP